MNFSNSLFFLLIGLIFCDNELFSGDEYKSLSAKEKMNRLWTEITSNQNAAEWYPKSDLLELFTEDQWLSFNTYGDVMPKNRRKLIHTVGAVAQAEWVSVGDHPYTGIYKSGNKNVIIRLSLAKKPDISKTSAKGALNNFTPGMGMKFLIDGEYSTNLLAMNSTSGQDSWNIFKRDITPQFDVSDHESFAEKLLARKFISVTYWALSVANSELSKFTNKGKTEGQIKYPFKLIFKPNEQLRESLPDNFKEDYITQVLKVPEGTVLYEIYAIEEPGCDEHKIGELRTTSKFTTSFFGDRHLFFRHPLTEEDFVGHEDWKEYRHQYGYLGQYEAKKAIPKACPFAKILGS